MLYVTTYNRTVVNDILKLILYEITVWSGSDSERLLGKSRQSRKSLIPARRFKSARSPQGWGRPPGKSLGSSNGCDRLGNK